MLHNQNKYRAAVENCILLSEIITLLENKEKISPDHLQKLIAIGVHFDESVKNEIISLAIQSGIDYVEFNEIWDAVKEEGRESDTICSGVCGEDYLCDKMKMINRCSPAEFPTYIPAKYEETFSTQLFTRYYKDDLTYHYGTQSFYKYTNGVWSKVYDDMIHMILERFLMTFLPEDQLSNGRIDTITRRLKKQEEIFYEGEFNSVKYLLNLKNGMLDLRTKEFQPHSKSYKTTVQFPITYDADARCPFFEEKLWEIFDGREEIIDYFLKWMMYTLLPTYEYQKALLLIGRGGNGKSKLTGIWRELLGEDNISNQEFSNLSGNEHYSAYQLVNKYANFSSELSSLEKDSHVFKSLTGNDKISARQIREKPIEFRNIARLIISANSYPRFKHMDTAIIRRFDIIDFTKRFDENPDTMLEMKFKKELPGIFNLVVSKYESIITEDGGIYFEAPQGVVRNVLQFKEKSDSVAEFVKEKCTLSQNEDSSYAVTLQSLYQSYSNWSIEEYGGSPKTRSVFKDELWSLFDCETINVKSIKPLEGEAIKNVNWVQGIRLSNYDKSKTVSMEEMDRLLHRPTAQVVNIPYLATGIGINSASISHANSESYDEEAA